MRTGRYLLLLILWTDASVWAAADPEAVLPERTQLALDDLRTFTEVFARIQRDYVEDTDDRDLLQNAIRGMLSELDPHTSFLTAEQYLALEEDTSGEYGGIGVEVLWVDGEMSIHSITPGGPAERAGIAIDDVIVAINGDRVIDRPRPEAMDQVRGQVGTDVTLRLRNESGERDVNVTREIIAVASVAAELIDGAYGYIQVGTFQADTAEEVSAALVSLTAEAERPLAGLVLDLRGNPGGVLSAAVGLADLFLTDGLIAYTRARNTEAELSFTAAPDDELNGAPIIVLVDEGSASASEVVAGALQDQGRALVLGTRTFGKGSVQTVLPLANGGAIKLTTSRYYTPSGRSIQAAGIEPDVNIAGDGYVTIQGPSGRREADLEGHLTGETELPETMTELSDDYALHRALSLLRAHRILGRLESSPRPQQQ